MSNVIDIQSAKPHMEGKAKCLDCGTEWPGMAPIGVVELECPHCNTMRGCWCGACELNEGESILVCQCDNDMFLVSIDYLKCARCGVRQER